MATPEDAWALIITHDGCQNDISDAFDLLDYISHSPLESLARCYLHSVEALTLVSRSGPWWSFVELVADQLLVTPIMTGTEVQKVISRGLGEVLGARLFHNVDVAQAPAESEKEGNDGTLSWQ